MLDTSNYYPFRIGRIAELDDDKLTTSELVHRHLDGVRLVNAFNNILAHHIPQLARPSGAANRTALPIAGDHAEAKSDAATLIDRLGGRGTLCPSRGHAGWRRYRTPTAWAASTRTAAATALVCTRRFALPSAGRRYPSEVDQRRPSRCVSW